MVKTPRCFVRLWPPLQIPDRPLKRGLCFYAASLRGRSAASRTSLSPRRLKGSILIVRAKGGAPSSCDLAC